MAAVDNLTAAIGDSVERARVRVNRAPPALADRYNGALRAAGIQLDRFLAAQAIELSETAIIGLFDGIGS